MFSIKLPFVLASASPRRQDLLAEVGLHPEILPADGLNGFVEPVPNVGEAPQVYALRAAQGKAQVVAGLRPESLVLAADTIVVLPHAKGPVVLGKPKNVENALHMLRQLNGTTHQVITACCLHGPNFACEAFCVATDVEFSLWPDATLAAYARSGEGLDKAGAYAIQGIGGFLSAGIRGSWSNVVGLPVGQVVQRLMNLGVLQTGS